jgi:hypothetical protein
MARRIELGDIGDYVEGQFNKLLTAAVLTTDKAAKMNSPVDTGRFRASWAVGENAAGKYDVGELGESTGKYKRSNKPPGTPPAGPPVGINYAPGQEKLGNVYSVHNNLPYAEALGMGRSKQASAGWIDAIAKAVQKYVDSEANRIGRES